jgi:drug/metabolite transporter (DMT)-like permease
MFSIKPINFPILLAILSAALFGIATPLSKLLLDDLNPFLLAGLLYLGASIGLFPIVIYKKEYFELFKLNRINRLRLTGAIILGGIIGPVFLLFGLKLASASSVSLWMNLELVATVVLGFILFKDYLGTIGWIGVAIALISGILLTMTETNAGFYSAILVFFACICWGFDNHFTALIDGISAVQSTFIKGFFAGIVNTVIGFIISGSMFTYKGIFFAAILGSISYGLSIVLYIISAQKLGAIRSQIIFSSAPFFGVFFAVFLLSENITILQIIAFIMLVISIVLISYEKHDHYHEHQDLEHKHIHKHRNNHHDHDHANTNFIPERADEKIYHEHFHTHKKKTHSHPHWPDIHHRHRH